MTARSLAFVLVLGVAACGGEDSEPAGSGGSTGAGGGAAMGTGGATAGGGSGGGESICGVSRCQAGQHCFNGVCVNGCLTSENCLSNQTCEDIDEFTNIGTCRDAAVAPMKDCQAFCEKALACMDPEAALCNQKCAGLSSACVACVNDSNCGAGCDDACAL